MESRRSDDALHRVTYQDPALAGIMILRNFFSHDECDKILEESTEWDIESAKVYMNPGGWDEKEEHKLRKGVIRHLRNPTNEYGWIHNIIFEAAQHYRAHYRRTHPIIPDKPIIVLEVATYVEPGDHFNVHQDTYIKNNYIVENNNRTRKLSMSCLLNEEFSGGKLCFKNKEGDMFPLEMYKGDVVVFPSYSVHKVEPLLDGERYSLVSWVMGPLYR